MLRRLAIVPFFLWADLAWAIDTAQQRSGGSGGGCCCALILLIIFRMGDVDWGRAIGTAIVPGIFGWFIWRDTSLGTGVRWVALISAVSQIAGLLLVLGLMVFLFFAGGSLASLGSTSAAEKKVIFREGFLRRCGANSSPEVCECIASAAATRDENDLKQLGFGIETGGLQMWLNEARTRCGGSAPTGKAGTPSAPKKSTRVPRNDEADPLGLHPKCTISSNPAGAKVFIDDEERGVTPFETRLTAVQENHVRAELLGFFPETKVLTPNTNEQTTLSFELRAASRVRVKTEPPGASVVIGDKVALKATPGVTGPLEPGEVDLLISRAGYQAVTKHLTVGTTEESLELSLVPGARVAVESTTEGAEVRLDGQLLGLAPLDVYLPPKGKHTLTVSKEGFSTVKKVFTKVGSSEHLVANLVDVQLATLRAKVKKMRAAYDQANLALEKLQQKRDTDPNPPAALLRKIDNAEKVMESTSSAYEAAESALRAAEESR
jgi:hypothetical protein